MIPLGGNDFPTTPAELADALRIALREYVLLPDEQSAVTADTDRLRIDLTGGTTLTPSGPADTSGVGQTQPGPACRSFDVLAHPIRAEGTNIHFDLTATDVRFNFDRNRAGRPVLTLAGATDGRVVARVSQSELNALVTAKAQEAAQAKGVQIERIDWTLTPLGPRSVRLDAKAAVATKALFKTIRGAVAFAGRVVIDDRLVAKLSELNVAGEGMMIAMAVNMVRGKITAMEGREFPLATLALGGVKLRDVQLQVGDDLAVAAAFGG
jgi:hypothetical protein